ncbi:MAG: lipoate--protein ligase family protein [Anaerococcus sp.]|nr:lipoate--protein ligase family protein [Peptoniphilaceae bacterium]MDY3055689.1 lipoate--protein ligase family protein [Anaerococcus sp.]
MKARIIDLKSTNPYKNVASEYAYYTNLDKDQVIFLLWQNSPCVVMGRNQNAYQELDLEFINKENILPVRRFTGGGAVYHDLGNLNFTFISSQKNKDMDKWMAIVLKALEKSKIRGKLDGRNDLTVDGKKFSGMAFIEDEEKFMVHGTLMVDLDLNVLEKCLTPDISKFTGKGIKSVRSRVCNLKDLDKDLDIETLKKNLIETFKDFYPSSQEEIHQDQAGELATYKKISEDEWIYGKNEKAHIERRYYHKNKPLDFEFWIENDIIKVIEVYSDSLDLKALDGLKSSLEGEKYSQIHIEEKINKYMK